MCYTNPESADRLIILPTLGGGVSKLIDRLVQTAETVSSPMGFRVIQPAPAKPKMTLIARIEPAADIAQLADYVSSVDAAIIALAGTSQKAVTDIARSLPDTVWGLWLEEKSRQPITASIKAGADFFIMPLDSEFDLPGIEKAGKILLVESSLSEGLIRTINELPVDAVLLADGEGEKSAVTWHQLMLCQRFADLLSKPLLLTVPASVSRAELKALWDTGVNGVVIPVKTAKQAEKLKGLRQIIDKSDFTARPRKKVAALLPHTGEETTAAIPDVEEEEEE